MAAGQNGWLLGSDKTKLNALSGTNTGDVTETLTTVTGRGASTANAVTLSGGLTVSAATALTFGHASANVLTTNTSGASLTISTVDAATAGVLTLKAGASSTAVSAGGDARLWAGAAGATGAGGAISILSGSGGTTSGASGNILIQTYSVTNGGSGASGNVVIKSGEPNLGASGNVTLSTGSANTVGLLSIIGGSSYSSTVGGSIAITGGIGGTASSAGGSITITAGKGGTANGAGGNLTLDAGALTGAGAGGQVYLGTSNAFSVGIGRTGISTTVTGTVKLPTVGTSGFVKLGAGGTLSADTTTYATGGGSATGTNTGDETLATIKTKLGITTLSGANTGDQTTVSGNAGSATVLKTARNINGVSFDGSADITINAVDATARVATSLMGVPDGVATLGSNGKVLAEQLTASSSEWTTVSADYLASSGSNLMCNTGTLGFTVTLPSTPATNSTVKLADYAGTFGTFPVIVTSDSKIMGLAESLTLDISNSSVTLTFIDSTTGWRLV